MEDHSPISRRHVLQLTGTATALSIAGCTDSGSDESPTSTGGGEEQLQDLVTISLGYTPDVTADFWVELYGVLPYFTNILEPLVMVTTDMRPQPWLAKSWEQTGDKTWEFTLQEDVTFHNGKKLTPEAVKFSIGELFEGFGNARAFVQLQGAESVRKVDDMTVEFTTNTPIANYPAHIAHNMIAMQHPDAKSKKKKPIGTGPFQLEERKKDQFVKASKFDDYWGEEDPNVSEITFRVLGDPNTRTLALTKHDIDIAYNPPHSKIDKLRNAKKTNAITQQRPEVALVGINIYKSPTDDVKLRRALNYAVSQQTLVETVLNNIGVPARGPISPMIFWAAHDEVRTYKQNTQKAKQLVEESSYDGEELIFLLSKEGNPQADLIAQTLQQWFTEIGVKTKLQVLEYATYSDRWSAGKGHLNLQDPGTFSAAADYILYSMFHSEGQQNHKVHERDGTGIMNPSEKVDQLIVEGRGTLDEDVKEENYRKVQKIAMEQALLVPLYYMEYLVGTYKDVTDLHTHPVSQMTLWASLKHHK